MTKIRIITDSAAHFADPQFVAQHRISVAPFNVRIGSSDYLEGVDLSPDMYWRYMQSGAPLPTVTAPTVAQYVALMQPYSGALATVIAIISTPAMSESFENARKAQQQLLGRVDVRLVDSTSISVGQGLLVSVAARAAAAGESADMIVHRLHGMVARLYTMFYIDSMQPLEAMGHTSKAQTILGTMLEVKPLLAVEEGQIVPVEKVFNRAAGFDRLAEFTAEFADLQDLLIVHGNAEQADDVRALRDRLATEFPGQYIPVVPYGPSLAQHIGPSALGVVVHDSDSDD